MKNYFKLFAFFFFAALFLMSCKKEIINDAGNNYFMIYLSNNSTGRLYISSTRYNESPQNIIVNEDSILIKQGGLYHFEGFISVGNATRNSPANPVYYELGMYLKARFYTLAQGFTNTVGVVDAGASHFSIDIPVDDNDGIHFVRTLQNSLGANVITRFSGYLVRRL
jgi:hypothetical protein